MQSVIRTGRPSMSAVRGESCRSGPTQFYEAFTPIANLDRIFTGIFLRIYEVFLLVIMLYLESL